MPGFGSGPFGSGGFGEWPWSLQTIVRMPPGIYKDQDELVADGVLQALLEGLAPQLDGLRRKIRDYDDLRDPLRCPAEDDFERGVTILKTEWLDDGTSRVFISEGTDGDKLDGLRPGMVLIDLRSLRFTISQIDTAAREGDVDDPPIDPATGLPIYKNIIIENIGQVSTEYIPFVSGTAVSDENPVDPGVGPPGPGNAFPNWPDNRDDGAEESPYIFNLDPTATYVAAVPITQNRLELTWTEGAVVKTGFFTNAGLPGGDVDDNSTVNFDLGQIVLYNVGFGIIDADTIRVDYVVEDSPIPEDGLIRAQNILAFLAADYGINLDQNDPTTLQRSYVYQAYQLWDIKGTAQSYNVLGEIAGYFVKASALNKVSAGIAATLPGSDVFEFPAGSGEWYTTINPGRARFDEVALDAIPLDLLCIDATYPEVVQTINVDSVTFVEAEGSRTRNVLVISTLSMEESYGTEGTLIDSGAGTFEIEGFERLSSSTYQVEVVSFTTPLTGAGTMTWKVLRFEVPNTIDVGTDTIAVDRGLGSVGYTGKRYRMTRAPAFVDPPIADVGTWAFIDKDGVVSYLESFEPDVSGNSRWEIVSDTVPAIGTGGIFYKCQIVTTCDFCRASSLLIRISPTTILSYPEALEGDVLERLILRLGQMIPAHVRTKAFLYDPGPATAAWGTIAVSSTISISSEDDALYSAIYDEDEFPADAIPCDSAPIMATSEVTITNENVMEEYISGDDPIISGAWTATGLWHVTQYRCGTQYRAFNYGQNDVGREGEPGSNPPDYDGVVAATVSRLTSPTFPLASTDTVNLRFRHYGDVRGVAGDDLVRVELYRTGPTLMKTIDKTALGLASGTNISMTSFALDISADASVTDTYWLEFVYDEGTNPGGSGVGTGEGWYIDDIEVQATP